MLANRVAHQVGLKMFSSHIPNDYISKLKYARSSSSDNKSSLSISPMILYNYTKVLLVSNSINLSMCSIATFMSILQDNTLSNIFACAFGSGALINAYCIKNNLQDLKFLRKKLNN